MTAACSTLSNGKQVMNTPVFDEHIGLLPVSNLDIQYNKITYSIHSLISISDCIILKWTAISKSNYRGMYHSVVTKTRSTAKQDRKKKSADLSTARFAWGMYVANQCKCASRVYWLCHQEKQSESPASCLVFLIAQQENRFRQKKMVGDVGRPEQSRGVHDRPWSRVTSRL